MYTNVLLYSMCYNVHVRDLRVGHMLFSFYTNQVSYACEDLSTHLWVYMRLRPRWDVERCSESPFCDDPGIAVRGCCSPACGAHMRVTWVCIRSQCVHGNEPSKAGSFSACLMWPVIGRRGRESELPGPFHKPMLS